MLAACALGAGSVPIRAEAAPGLPALPRPQGYVSDFARLLDPAARSSLEARLAAYDRATGNQIAVAVLPDLGGVPINEYTVRLEEAWKVGRKGRDNGVLLLVAQRERQVRIEVGYGLEGRITDADAGRIIREGLAPAFREGRYADGLRAAVEAIIGLIGAPAGAAPGPARSPAPGGAAGPGAARPVVQRGGGIGLLPLVLFLVFLGVALAASRPRPRRCPRCGTPMQASEQSARAGIGAVEAWTCPHCGYREKRLLRSPMIVPAPYWIGGGWGSGGFGGGAGGGFGGFGGGASGGGGATGGW